MIMWIDASMNAINSMQAISSKNHFPKSNFLVDYLVKAKDRMDTGLILIVLMTIFVIFMVGYAFHVAGKNMIRSIVPTM